jgi:hypothetical protein
MFVADTYNPHEAGLTNAKTVVGLEWLYEGMQKHLGKLLFLIVVVLVALPFVFLLGYWLRTKRRKFQKHMKKELSTFNEHETYLKFKNALVKLDELLPTLKKVSGYNLKKTPIILRYTLSQMQKMTSTLVTYSSWQKSRLRVLNEEQFKSKATVFKFISEKELWESRNQVYKYWM